MPSVAHRADHAVRFAAWLSHFQRPTATAPPPPLHHGMRLASGVNARQNPKNSNYFRTEMDLRIITPAAKIIGILRILCEYAALTPLANPNTLCNRGGGGDMISHQSTPTTTT